MQLTDVRGEAKDIWLHVEPRGRGDPPNLSINFSTTDTFLPEAPFSELFSQFWHLITSHLPLFTDDFGSSQTENLEK